MSSIMDAVTAWQEERLSGAALMREIVAYNTWSVQISEAAAAEAVQDGGLSRLMFTLDEQGVSTLSLSPKWY